jgi:hypothetical protein
LDHLQPGRGLAQTPIAVGAICALLAYAAYIRGLNFLVWILLAASGYFFTLAIKAKSRNTKTEKKS